MSLERVQVLHGHVDFDTARVVDDYPYGRLRCEIRFWVETGVKGAGKDRQRFVSRTCNPRNGRWNTPKASTYNDMTIMYLDEKNHVHAWGIDAAHITGEGDARIRIRGVYDQMTDEQRRKYDLWLAVNKKLSPVSWRAWSDLVQRVAAYIRDTGADPELVNGVWTDPDGDRHYMQRDGEAVFAAARLQLAAAEAEASAVTAVEVDGVTVAVISHVDAATPAGSSDTPTSATDAGEAVTASVLAAVAAIDAL